MVEYCNNGRTSGGKRKMVGGGDCVLKYPKGHWGFSGERGGGGGIKGPGWAGRMEERKGGGKRGDTDGNKDGDVRESRHFGQCCP